MREIIEWPDLSNEARRAILDRIAKERR